MLRIKWYSSQLYTEVDMDWQGRTAMHNAAAQGSVRAIEALVGHKADMDVLDLGGRCQHSA